MTPSRPRRKRAPVVSRLTLAWTAFGVLACVIALYAALWGANALRPQRIALAVAPGAETMARPEPIPTRSALRPGAAGERFLCVGGNMTMHEMASVLRAHMPERANKLPRRSLPHWMVRAASLFDPVTRAVIFDLGIRRVCDTSKARRLLGFAPRPLADTVRDTADSLVAQGIVS